jgi:hypothetical protein
MGWGKTAEEAVADLLEQIEEAREQRRAVPQAGEVLELRARLRRQPSARSARRAAGYTALKAITARARAGVQPITKPLPPCRYRPKALCDCGLRGLCLEPA